jgi:hypothetical protein
VRHHRRQSVPPIRSRDPRTERSVRSQFCRFGILKCGRARNGGNCEAKGDCRQPIEVCRQGSRWKWLFLLAPRAGFEPATIRLTVECSTAELPRNKRNLFATGQRITKPPSLAKDEIGRSGAVSIRGGNSLPRKDLSPISTIRESRSGTSPGDRATPARHEPSAKKTYSPTTLHHARFEPLR